MKISRIALASLISFGVLGGASLNASASHHSHYQKILWNKTMSHHKVALKNGKGIIWNKPYKTAKNAKIKYRISHKKGFVLTTIRHMKVKGGSIYYFVKAGKVSGWINKKSVELAKSSIDKSTSTFEVPTSTATPTPATPAAPATPSPSNNVNTTNNVNVSKANTNPAPVYSPIYNTGNVQPSVPDTATNDNPFAQYTTGKIKAALSATPHNTGAVVYNKVWKDGKLVDTSINTTLAANTEVQMALNDHHATAQVLIRTKDGKTVGYIDRDQLGLPSKDGVIASYGSKSETPAKNPESKDVPVQPVNTPNNK
ncbi:GW dipeptide domain-containing protein [Lentilactobacillus otakiensis]|uniref:GW dipeptide domain-containing protein n=1 Tax=Lentilactobacillus otakiensis TaxID=481720 RepID=UPI003D16F184